jgi:6-phosphogluconolactonase (cycloisomerase 2 family)
LLRNPDKHPEGIDVPPQPSNVSSFRIAKNGTLAPFSSGILPMAVVADPFGRYVYAANSGTQELDTENIAGYRVAQNGALKPLKDSPFANGEGPESAAMDPWGRFLYVANFFDEVLSVYRIAGNGNLTPVAGSPFATTPVSSIVVVDPQGRFLYVANSFEPAISVYHIAGNGALTQLPGSPFHVETEPDSMVIDLTGRFLYLANETGVSAYRIAGNGTFSNNLGQTVGQAYQAAKITRDASGQLISYTSAITHGWVSAGGKLRDVNGLLNGASKGWEISVARKINDRGEVLADANFNNGEVHEVLLTPSAILPALGSVIP